ncbi:MAG: dipeptidase PepV [Halanaerobium sp.]
MKDKIRERAEFLKDNMILSTQELVRIPSVEAEPEGDYPYGRNVYQALARALEISENLGFKTKNIDNQAAHVEMGEGEEILALLCHLDVVPEGSDWTYPPYAAEIHDDKIYGRGTIDDKGPAVAALYAMKIVQELGVKLNKRVRLILGTNEESGMASLDHYFKKEKMPELAFSPDATFPAIHAEKGILDLKFSAKIGKAKDKNGLQLKEIKGGNATNMVPDYAEAVLSGIEKKQLLKLLSDIKYEQDDLKIEAENNNLKLSYHGISAHGSMPEDGKNAISYLIDILAELPFEAAEVRDFFNFYKNKIGLEYDGASIGCKDQDDVPTALTFNTGIIKGGQNKIEFIVNIRYPVKSSAKKVVSDIKTELIDLIEVELLRDAEPLFIAKDDPFIKKLMAAYQEFTGDQSEPIAIGGGTYARKVKKGVAFGPLFPGQPELAHQKDEHIGIDDLVKSAAIYARAIIDIAGVKTDE